MHPRTWPWWMWATLCALGLFVGACIAVGLIRQAGLQAIEAKAAPLRKAGFSVTVADLVARAPLVDTKRQERAWNLLNRSAAVPSSPAISIPKIDLTLLSAPSRISQAKTINHFLHASAHLHAEWLTLLNESPLCLTSLGWIARDIPEPIHAGLARVSAARTPSVLASHSTATMLALRALSNTDPLIRAQEMNALRLLVTASELPGGLIDGHRYIQVRKISDQTHLLSVLCGDHLPGEWMRQSTDIFAIIEQSLRNERMGLIFGLYTDVRTKKWGYWSILSPSLGAGAAAYATRFSLITYAFAPQNVYVLWDSLKTSENACRTGQGDLTSALTVMNENSWKYQIAGILMSNNSNLIISAAKATFTARALRLSALLTKHFRQTRSLPFDLHGISPLGYDIPLHDARLPNILYERLSDSRFRIYADPLGPPIDILRDESLSLPTIPTPLPAVFMSDWLVEIDAHQKFELLALDSSPVTP